MKPNPSPSSLYSPDVGRCCACGTMRPGWALTNGVCNDDWHGVVAPDESLLAELHAPKKPMKSKESR